MSAGRNVARSYTGAVGRSVSAVSGNLPSIPNWVDFHGDVNLGLAANTTMPARETNDVTVFFRLRQDTLVTGTVILRIEDSNFYDSINISTITSGTKLRVAIRNATNQITAYHDSGVTLATDTDQDVYFTYNAFTRLSTLSINGEASEADNSIYSVTTDTANLSDLTRIGLMGSHDGYGQTAGQITDVCVYNAAHPESSFRNNLGNALLPPTDSALIYFGGTMKAREWNAGRHFGSADTLQRADASSYDVDKYFSNYPFNVPKYVNFQPENAPLTLVDSTAIEAAIDTDDFTVSMWVYVPTYVGAGENLLVIDGASGNNVLQFYRTDDADIKTTLRKSDASIQWGPNFTTGYSSLQKIHLYYNYSRTDLQITTRVDDNTAVTAAISDLAIRFSDATDLSLLTDNTATVRLGDVTKIASVRIYEGNVPYHEVYNKKSTSPGGGDDTYYEVPPDDNYTVLFALGGVNKYAAALRDEESNGAAGAWGNISIDETVASASHVATYGLMNVLDDDPAETTPETITAHQSSPYAAVVLNNPYEGISWPATATRMQPHDHFSGGAGWDSETHARVDAFEQKTLLYNGQESVGQGYGCFAFMDHGGYESAGTPSAYPRVIPSDDGGPDESSGGQARSEPWRSVHTPINDWMPYSNPGDGTADAEITASGMEFIYGLEYRADANKYHAVRFFVEDYIENDLHSMTFKESLPLLAAGGAWVGVTHPYTDIVAYNDAGFDAMGIHNSAWFAKSKYPISSPEEAPERYTQLFQNWRSMLHIDHTIRCTAGNDNNGRKIFNAGASGRNNTLNPDDDTDVIDSGKIECFVSGSVTAAKVEAAMRAGNFVAVVDIEGDIGDGGETDGRDQAGEIKNNYPKIVDITVTSTTIAIDTDDPDNDSISWFTGYTGSHSKRFAFAKITKDTIATGESYIYTQAFLIK